MSVLRCRKTSCKKVISVGCKHKKIQLLFLRIARLSQNDEYGVFAQTEGSQPSVMYGADNDHGDVAVVRSTVFIGRAGIGENGKLAVGFQMA